MGGGGKAPGPNRSNTSTSWDSGTLNSNAISAEDLNNSMRGDIAANYLRGPVQKEYSGMSDATKGIIGDMRGYAGDTIERGGYTEDQRGAVDYYNAIMDGGAQDPAFARLKDNAIDAARTSINRQFGASGRFGSGLQMRDLGEGIANASAAMDYQNLARRDNAARTVFDMGGTGAQGMANAFQMQLAGQNAIDADNRARAAFDPNYEHLARYQALLGNNTATYQAPQRQEPGAMDYLMLGGGLMTAFL